MSMVPTHAGDDSEGKIRGIESVNILFMLAGLPTNAKGTPVTLPGSGTST